jgi:hypothetical protein
VSPFSATVLLDLVGFKNPNTQVPLTPDLKSDEKNLAKSGVH